MLWDAFRYQSSGSYEIRKEKSSHLLKSFKFLGILGVKLFSWSSPESLPYSDRQEHLVTQLKYHIPKGKLYVLAKKTQ